MEKNKMKMKNNDSWWIYYMISFTVFITILIVEEVEHNNKDNTPNVQNITKC